MGDVFIHASSALRLYRTLEHDARSSGLAPSRVASIASAQDRVDHGVVSSLRRHRLSALLEHAPLHVIVPAPSCPSRAGNGVRTHVWGGPLTSGAFLTCGDGIYLSSPEFVFLQMATLVDVIGLAQLGMELCGHYRLQDGQVVYQMPQLTSVERIGSFLSRMVGAPGARKAQEALRHMTDRSRSPAETALCLLLCLPTRTGGYALPVPSLEEPPTEGGDDSGWRNGSYIVWPGIALALAGEEDAPGDASVELVTYRALGTDEGLRDVARRVGVRMGLLIRKDTRAFSAARRVLRARVLPRDVGREEPDTPT